MSEKFASTYWLFVLIFIVTFLMQVLGLAGSHYHYTADVKLHHRAMVCFHRTVHVYFLNAETSPGRGD